MTGIRSSRRLENACRDQISFLWLTGWQRPDHNTLWRFYQTHRSALRSLLRHTVRTAIAVGLVARYDFEYQRNGTRNLFLFIEPQRGWRRGGDGKTHYARLWPPDAMAGR